MTEFDRALAILPSFPEAMLNRCGSLRALNARVELSGRDPRRVAGEWLRDQGLAGRDSFG